MAFVSDASVAAAWVLPDKNAVQAELASLDRRLNAAAASEGVAPFA